MLISNLRLKIGMAIASVTSAFRVLLLERGYISRLGLSWEIFRDAVISLKRDQLKRDQLPRHF